MRHICNLSENFTREIRYILIFDANVLTFGDNMKGLYPALNNYLLKIDIQNIPDYRRTLALKQQNKNDYFKLDISIPVIDLSFENRKTLYSFNNNRKYLVITASNKEMMLFGNSRERLSVDIHDIIKDNGKGKDFFSVKIFGESIIPPANSLRSLSENFRVLFFTYPLA